MTDDDINKTRTRITDVLVRRGIAAPGLDAYKLADELVNVVRSVQNERADRWQNAARDTAETCTVTLTRLAQAMPVIKAAQTWARGDDDSDNLLEAVNTYNQQRSNDS